MVSSRLSSIHESATVAMSNKAAEMQAAGIKVFNFGIGEPDFVTPSNIIDSAFEWAKKGKTHYTASNGILELREKISEKLKKKNGIDADPSNILVTPTKFAINLAFLSILEMGDEVIIPEPYYVSYPDIIRLSGGKPIGVPTFENYDFDEDAIRKLINPRSRALILSNPTNPTGKVYDEKSLRRISDIVLENDMYLITDEIYEELIFEGKMFSPASIKELSEKAITVGGFSKSYAMTGWRVGYMVASKEIIKASNKLQQQTMTCAPSVSQYAALEALKDEESPVKMREEFRKRRDLITKIVSEDGSFKFNKPNGTFYIFLKYPQNIDSQQYALKLLEQNHVIATPGSAFGCQGENHIRISFATSEQVIKEGVAELLMFNHSL